MAKTMKHLELSFRLQMPAEVSNGVLGVALLRVNERYTVASALYKQCLPNSCADPCPACASTSSMRHLAPDLHTHDTFPLAYPLQYS